MRRVLIASALLLTALALSGCAGEEGSPDPTPSTSPTSSATNTTTAAGNTSSSASSTSIAPRPAQTFDVDIQGNSFVEGTKTIQKGDTVRWTQKDSTTHTVTSDDGTSFDSGNMILVGPTSTFSHKFDVVGEFAYHCEVHPGMTDTITVVAALPA